MDARNNKIWIMDQTAAEMRYDDNDEQDRKNIENNNFQKWNRHDHHRYLICIFTHIKKIAHNLFTFFLLIRFLVLTVCSGLSGDWWCLAHNISYAEEKREKKMENGFKFRLSCANEWIVAIIVCLLSLKFSFGSYSPRKITSDLAIFPL